jgi:D-glycero-alpha-D-manno-heptose 1-phosphate guanylyltransferase
MKRLFWQEDWAPEFVRQLVKFQNQWHLSMANLFFIISLKHLRKNNIQTVILSVGYKWEMIHKEFGNEYLGIKIKYAIEEKQLGTGGGIKQALELVEGDKVYILNGDTYFNIDLQTLGEYHLTNSANLTLAAKPMKNFDRYGTIEIQEDGTVLAFNEKEPKDRGIINGGIYCMNTNALEDVKSDSFSLETAFFGTQSRDRRD